VPINYDPTAELDGRDRQMVEIAPQHFVWAAEDEIAIYQERAREFGLID
jgi:oligopeptide transport system ATP-binding protein